MLRVDEAFLRRAEERYPGIRGTIEFYESLDLPPCPHCGSEDTAEVSIGIVGRSIHIAAATTKMHLLPNAVPFDYHCNACRQYFGEIEGAAPEGTSLLLDPLNATKEDLEAFCRALNAERDRVRRLRRQRKSRKS